jgi:nucleotide-binding universal stress UspA family protein
MIKIKLILLPTDFSECSRQALTYALSFARRYRAKLILLHVVEADEYIAYAEESTSELSPDLRAKIIQAMEETASESFEQFLKSQDLEGVEIETKMVEGTPFVEIARLATELSVDMIVIGTSGRTAQMHPFFGSTAEKVVRQAPCPVLSVKPGEHQLGVSEKP